jgi:ABC-type transport system involved in cytochrome c biogenesis permease subunit
MSNSAEELTRQAKRKQLKFLMAMMLIFMVAGPLIGPKIFAEEFTQLRAVGRYVFYISTPAIFGAMFLFYLFLYRRKAESGGKNERFYRTCHCQTL